MADNTIIKASDGSDKPTLKSLSFKSTDKGVKKVINNNNLSEAKNANMAIKIMPTIAGNQKNSFQIKREFTSRNMPVMP